MIFFAVLIIPAHVGAQAPIAMDRDSLREQVRARLSRDRVATVEIREVELFPEGVASVRGTLTLREPHHANGRRSFSFDLMVGGRVEADPAGYGEGDVKDSPLNHHPKILSRVPPEYPERARRNGTVGEVRLFTLVLEDGSTVVLGVLTRLADGCTEAAVEAVEQWTWTPRTFFGRETGALGVASVRFPPRE